MGRDERGLVSVSGREILDRGARARVVCGFFACARIARPSLFFLGPEPTQFEGRSTPNKWAVIVRLGSGARVDDLYGLDLREEVVVVSGPRITIAFGFF